MLECGYKLETNPFVVNNTHVLFQMAPAQLMASLARFQGIFIP